MRTLSFDPTDRKYDYLYQACVFGDAPKDRTAGKVLGALLDKFERIGQGVPLVDDKGAPRDLGRGEVRLWETVSGGDVVLEEAEYDLLVARALAMIPTTKPAFVRDMERALAWLETLPKQDAAALAARPDEPAGVTGH